ncbi:MAG: hypothetical protein B7X02_02080 [Rhodospirillales bacterium 12-54-5]|nr:MAG: hypothetical protein B7X02_02080 [Rhodospirillales bacterium 12-54-5]
MLLSDAGFIRRVLISISVVGMALLLWQLRELLLLIFGSVVIAAMLHSIADPIHRHMTLSKKWALILAVLLIILMLTLASWFVGSEVSSEFSNLSTQLPNAWESFRTRMHTHPIGHYLLNNVDGLHSQNSSILEKVSAIIGAITSSIVDLALVLIGGLYFAADPQLYYNGITKLTPPSARKNVKDALASTGMALKKWLKAILIEMSVVVALTTAGLWMIGFPSAIALGLLAGVAAFIPYVGLFAAIIPTALIASAQSPEMLAWTLLVYAVVHLLEGNVITPLIEQKIVLMPPVVTIFSIVVFGILFGPLGVLFAAPLAVTITVLVKKLYSDTQPLSRET